MNLTFLFISTVLLNCCTLKTSATDLDIKAFNDENQRKTNKLKLPDLNADVLYLMLEQISVMDTLNLLEAIPFGTISSVAVAIYRKNYRNSKVELYVEKMNLIETEFYVDDNRNYIKICTCETVLKFIRHFGEAISTLQFNTQLFSREKASIINQYINKYGSESIKSLNLGLIYENSLEQFTVPFKEVENLYIGIDTTYEQEFKTGNLRLNQQFPKLHRFNLSIYNDVNMSFIQYNFPQLKHLKLRALSFLHNGTDHIAIFLAKNKQITNIDLLHVQDDYIRVVNKMLPQLESVTFHGLDGGNETLQFENVQQLIVLTRFVKSVEKLSFPRLQSLKMEYPLRPNEWDSFFKNHTDLTQFHLMKCSVYDEVKLKRFVARLTNLVELTVEYDNKWDVNTHKIRNIFKHHNKLMKLTMVCFKANRKLQTEFFDEMQTNFGNEWHIQEINGNSTGILFEKD